MKRRLLQISILGISIALSTMAHASSGWSVKHTDVEEGNDPNSEYYMRSNLPFKDDIATDQSVKKMTLTDEEKHQALVWGLDETEEKRYVLLMKNKSGNYYKNMTPVEVLGINARDNSERAHYAEMEANGEIERRSKELAFIGASHVAFQSLKEASGYPNVWPINYEKYAPNNYQPITLESGDKLILFVSLKDQVRPIVNELTNVIAKSNNAQLNIYLIDKTITKSEATHWAKSVSIPMDLVNSQKITINLNGDQYKKIANQKKTPLLLLVRNKQTEEIDTGRL